MLDQHACRSPRGCQIAKGARWRYVQVHPRDKHPVDALEGALELGSDRGNELGVLCRLARHERAFADGLEDAWPVLTWQPLVAHHGQGPRHVGLGDAYPPSPFGRRIRLLRRFDACVVERDEDAVCLRIVQPGLDGHGARSEAERQTWDKADGIETHGRVGECRTAEWPGPQSRVVRVSGCIPNREDARESSYCEVLRGMLRTIDRVSRARGIGALHRTVPDSPVADGSEAFAAGPGLAGQPSPFAFFQGPTASAASRETNIEAVKKGHAPARASSLWPHRSPKHCRHSMIAPSGVCSARGPIFAGTTTYGAMPWKASSSRTRALAAMSVEPIASPTRSRSSSRPAGSYRPARVRRSPRATGGTASMSRRYSSR